MALTKVVRLLRGGRITIPAAFRTKLAMNERSLLQITLTGQQLRVRSVQATDAPADSAGVRELYNLFAPVRKQAKHYSEQEIDADIERAVKRVRRTHRARRTRRKE